MSKKDATPELRTSPKSVADRHIWQIVGIRDLLYFGLILFLLWFGYYLRDVFTPVLVAIMLAYLVDPIIDYFEARRVPRPVTVSIVLVMLVVMLAGLSAWLGPLLFEQLQALARKMPQYLKSLSGHYGIGMGTLTEQVDEFIGRFRDDPMTVIQPLLTGTGTAFGFIGSVIGTTTGLMLFTVLIPIYFFFFAWHFDRIVNYFCRFLPASRKEEWLNIFRRMDLAVSGFFRGRLVIALITGVMYAAGWFLTEVPYWFLLGLVTGLLSIIPYISVVGWPLAVLLKYLDVVTTSGSSSVEWMPIVFWPSLAYLTVQFIESWILTPWIQSQSSDMSAVTVLIVVFIGGSIGGIYGLLLAIPFAACLKILFKDLFLPRIERWAERH